MKFLGPTAYDLAGEWKVVNGSHLAKCRYVSKTEVDCHGYKITLNGETVTTVSLDEENTGTISQSGKNYDTIKWRVGDVLWKKLGKYDKNDTNIVFQNSHNKSLLLEIRFNQIGNN